MERSKVTHALVAGACAVMLGLGGCANPFAPALRGSGESLWTDAGTVGDMLQNLVTAYEVRDSMQYADLLAPEFQFQYYDETLGRTDGWLRETELQTTARIFRAFSSINLDLFGLSSDLESIAAEDSVVQFQLTYRLSFDDELAAAAGFARFTLFKPAGDRFRIVLWQDEF